MILLNDYDDFSDIVVVPLDFFWIWVEVCDSPATLTTEATLRRHSPLRPLSGCGLPCPNAQEAEEGTGALLGPVAAPAALPIVFRANTHAALVVPNFPTLFREKRLVQIREVALYPSPAKVTGVIREREEEEAKNGKRLKLSLAMVPLDLNLEDLGFSMAMSGVLGIKKTGKSPKKRGRPRGNKNKKQLLTGESSSSMEDSVIHDPLSNEETGGE
ncbi:hypothetical protein ACLB2K_003401 [Fragaria x ananassa]